MAQIRKMDFQFEVKSSADEFRHKPQLMPKMSNHVIKDVKLVQGDWKSIGAVRLWSFVAGCKIETAKDNLENADNNNKTIILRVVEGELLNYYKNCKFTLNVMPNGEGSLAKWTTQYEKLNESFPRPIIYADFFTTWYKITDAYLINALLSN